MTLKPSKHSIRLIVLLSVAVSLSLLSAHAEIQTGVTINDLGFGSYDRIRITLTTINSGEPIPDTMIFGILELFGEYYFRPSYTTAIDYNIHTIPSGAFHYSLLDFVFSDIDSMMPFGPIEYWGAWYLSEASFGYGHVVFYLDEALHWTPTQTSTPETPTETPTQTPTCTPTPLPAEPRMILISGGTYITGVPNGELCGGMWQEDYGYHYPVLIQNTEVQQFQWIEIFGVNPSSHVGLALPVENVTWIDACIFCNRLSIRDGFTPCYYVDEVFQIALDGTPPVYDPPVYWNHDTNGYRLPWAPEWEFACRAGTTTAYNSGEDNISCTCDVLLDPIAWYICSSSATHSCGQKQPNAWGLFDMHGNVQEWCWSSQNTWTYFQSTRGGSYTDYAQDCRSGASYVQSCQNPDSFTGFRIARSLVFSQ